MNYSRRPENWGDAVAYLCGLALVAMLWLLPGMAGATLLVDLRAADIVGLSDGDAVSTFPDASGNGHNATSTGTARPIYKTGIAPSGSAVVRFDGSNDCAQIAALTLPPSITIIAALNTTTPLFFEHGPNANTDYGMYFYGSRGRLWLVNRSSGNTNAEGSVNWQQTGIWSVITGRFDESQSCASKVIARQNGAAVDTGTHTCGTVTGNVTDTFNIFSRNCSAVFMAGDICELRIYDTALSDADVLTAEAEVRANCVDTPTPTPATTATPTVTPTPTDTPTNTPTSTPTDTPTSTPTGASTATATPSSTATLPPRCRTYTPTPSPTAAYCRTYTPGPAATPVRWAHDRCAGTFLRTETWVPGMIECPVDTCHTVWMWQEECAALRTPTPTP